MLAQMRLKHFPDLPDPHSCALPALNSEGRRGDKNLPDSNQTGRAPSWRAVVLPSMMQKREGGEPSFQTLPYRLAHVFSYKFLPTEYHPQAPYL